MKSATRSLPPAVSPCEKYLWRRLISEMAAPRSPYWFGNDPRWRLKLEAQARAKYGATLTVKELPGRRLLYRVAVDVHGPAQLTDIVVLFAENPDWDCYGRDPRDYPRVWAEPEQASKHRMPDDALCLWFPGDPRERRWTSDKGLLDLLNVSIDHLLAEQYWRATGGFDGGIWMFDEAGHGFEQEAA